MATCQRVACQPIKAPSHERLAPSPRGSLRSSPSDGIRDYRIPYGLIGVFEEDETAIGVFLDFCRDGEGSGAPAFHEGWDRIRFLSGTHLQPRANVLRRRYGSFHLTIKE